MRGINDYLIGIALLIFGYVIDELVVAEIDPSQQEKSELRNNLLKSTPSTASSRSSPR
mgnify:CR=1 FL=1